MHDRNWQTRDPGKDRYECSVRVVGRALREVCHKRKVCLFVRDRLVDLATPELCLLEKICVKTGNDSKVIATSLEGTEKTWVMCAGSGNDCTVSKNYFIGCNVVASEAIAAREE